MARTCLVIVGLVAAICAASPVRAWSPATRARMAEEAVRFMPATLRTALEGHREPLLRGVLAPLADEDAPTHAAPWNGGSLDATIDAEARALVLALSRRSSFTELAERFGRLAHFVMDASFPPGIGRDGEPRYRHFAAFCESRREKFPLVFYGHDDPSTAPAADFSSFGLAVMERARREDLELARAYRAAGNPPSPAAFDDRSVPFAVGSLAYSRGTTDIVRIWLAAWRRAGGDLGRTPYLEPETPPRRSP